MSDWYYLSFADEKDFLGAAYVQAFGEVHAVTQAHALGCNPGGEVAIVGPLPAEAMDENVPPCDRERLLSREEVDCS